MIFKNKQTIFDVLANAIANEQAKEIKKKRRLTAGTKTEKMYECYKLQHCNISMMLKLSINGLYLTDLQPFKMARTPMFGTNYKSF